MYTMQTIQTLQLLVAIKMPDGNGIAIFGLMPVIVIKLIECIRRERARRITTVIWAIKTECMLAESMENHAYLVISASTLPLYNS